MYTLPLEIILIILDKYALKNTRLICSTIKTHVQLKYYENMINITMREQIDYANVTESFYIRTQDEYIFSNLLIMKINHYKVEFYESDNLIIKKNSHLDIVSQYKILSSRYNNEKCNKIIKTKLDEPLYINNHREKAKNMYNFIINHINNL